MTSPRSAKEGGIEAGQRAVDRTEREVPDWSEQALHYLRRFAAMCARYRKVPGMKNAFGIQPFTGEEFRFWAEVRGLPPPADARSYGPIIAKAIRDGLIVKVGYASTVSSNGSVRATYRRA